VLVAPSPTPVVAPDGGMLVESLVVPRSDGGIVVEALSAADAAPAPADAPARLPAARPVRERAPGWLTIDSKPYATVFIDGRNVGTTPLLRMSLSPGPHLLRAVTASGKQQRLRVVIEPGREAPRRRLVW
jgi:hypothetical protein